MREEVLEQVNTVIFYYVKDGEILVGRCTQMDLHKLMAEEVSLYMVVSIGDQQDALISKKEMPNLMNFFQDSAIATFLLK